MQKLQPIKQCPICKVTNNIEQVQKKCLDGPLFLVRCKVCGHFSIATTETRAVSLWNEMYKREISKERILSPQTRAKIKEIFGDTDQRSESK